MCKLRTCNYFLQEVKKQMNGEGSLSANYNIFAFSTSTLNDILCKFSEPNFVKVAVTYLCMVSRFEKYFFFTSWEFKT